MAIAHCEWGLNGVETFREKVSVIVIVDVLSISTAVDVAVARGASIYPFPYQSDDAAQKEAMRLGAVLAHPRRASGGQFSLSPMSLADIPKGLKLMLPSPNGSRLSLAGGRTPMLTGCLRNAKAVAAAAKSIAGTGDIAVIPAGERWPDGGLRPAIEDLLGAGAILSGLNLRCSPEAHIARDAFQKAVEEIGFLVRQSMSGRELCDGGFPGDVEMAVDLNVSTCAPVLIDGAYSTWHA